MLTNRLHAGLGQNGSDPVLGAFDAVGAAHDVERGDSQAQQKNQNRDNDNEFNQGKTMWWADGSVKPEHRIPCTAGQHTDQSLMKYSSCLLNNAIFGQEYDNMT